MAPPMNPADGPDSPLAGVPAVLAAARWEWFRLSRRVAFWIIAGLAAAGVAATLVVMLLASKFGDFPFGSYDYPSAVAAMLGAVGPFLAVILASIIFGGDFGWGTWRTLAARGMARWQIALAKLLLAGAALAVFWAAAWMLAAIVGLQRARKNWAPAAAMVPAAGVSRRSKRARPGWWPSLIWDSAPCLPQPAVPPCSDWPSGLGSSCSSWRSIRWPGLPVKR